jgi:hypothetical protein
MPAATLSRTLWYAIELCFLLNIEVGMVDLVTTDLLSQNTLLGPSIGIPSMRNLHRSASIISTPIRIATNSDPNVDDSTVLWDFEYHMMGAQLININIPVWDRLVTLFAA